MTDNPLLKESAHPHGAPQLDAVSPEYFLPAIKAAIQEAKEEIAAIKGNPAKPTFENTIEALEFAGVKLSRISSVFNDVAGSKSNDDIRAIEEDIVAELVRFSNERAMDRALFARIKAVYDARNSLMLDPDQKMLLEETYKGYVRSGALLDDASQQELAKINEKLGELTTRFENNTVKATKAFEKWIDDESMLAGVPDRAKAEYREAAEQAGQPGRFLIRLSPPPIDILTHADNRALREEISRARANISFGGEFDNREIVLEIVKLRHRFAELMGYKNFAAYVLDDRMAKTPEAVMGFLEKNEKIYRPAAEAHLEAVRAYADKVDGLKDLKPWDIAYYDRRLQEETYDLDLESLRPYFDLEKVLEGLRQHAEKLFGITMVETRSKYPVYDADVKVYEVKDKDTGALVGIFYADYYARAGEKRNGAWMSAYRDRGIEHGKDAVPIVKNTCNFPKPTKEAPTLLSVDEVRTLFHEFGHGLHALLAEGKYSSINGTNVKWDFVELPSQLQENWAKQKEVLDTFARHYKNGELIPADLVKKMQDSENFGVGYVGLRQTYQAILDMKWHTTDPSNITSVEEFEDSVLAEHWLFPRHAGTMSTSFGHLFAGGYAAGYYSYKWAEVLEADIFEQFENSGLYDGALGKKLRGTVYSEGGRKPPEKVFEGMMGRAPDPDALFRREGLLPKNDNKAQKPPRQA